ncbi:hypothetical protein [Halorhodospira neutriphila]|uniref:Uncharacterized protein n=1 Tax=Halorhodospira neutriphila TaxID=168379 RepID=A0ABS1E254_9GAMM|nr:hypothetical protein [Halorhodospira neutriphila]MBK1725856.1 hypothetical protein [Halorhodospira neutriphila]
MSRSRKRAKGTQGAAAGTGEEARAIETLIRQIEDPQASAEAQQQWAGALEERLERCLHRGRTRPLHEALGRLAAQWRWAELEDLRAWIGRLSCQEPVPLAGDDGEPMPGEAELFIAPLVIRRPEALPADGEPLAPPEASMQALTESFRRCGAIGEGESIVLASALLPPEAVYGLDWLQVRRLTQALLALAEGEQAEARFDQLLSSEAPAGPDYGVRLALGLRLGPAPLASDFFTDVADEDGLEAAELAWTRAFAEPLDAWLGVEDAEREGTLALVPQPFYSALEEGLSQAEDLAAFHQLMAHLEREYRGEVFSLQADVSGDSAALLLRAFGAQADVPLAEIRRALRPHEDALARADWLEDLFPDGGEAESAEEEDEAELPPPLQWAGRQTGGSGSGGSQRYH